jgi:hypothetical protein
VAVPIAVTLDFIAVDCIVRLSTFFGDDTFDFIAVDCIVWLSSSSGDDLLHLTLEQLKLVDPSVPLPANDKSQNSLLIPASIGRLDIDVCRSDCCLQGLIITSLAAPSTIICSQSPSSSPASSFNKEFEATEA